MSVVAPVRLDSLRGGWLTPDEATVWDEFQAMPFDEITESDVVAVLGAAGGGIAAYVRRFSPAHLVLVEADKGNRRLLEMSWRGARGVSIVNADPVAVFPEILVKHLPSVAVLNLGRQTTDLEVVGALALRHESLEILCIRYGEWTARATAMDDMLQTWHEGELRWRARTHEGPSTTRLYVR